MTSRRSAGMAWVALALALAAHVTDEALTDFLSIYNPTVRTIRQHLPFLPLPEFSFAIWLGGLIALVMILLALSPFAFRGARWMLPLSYALGAIMVGNGLLHIGSSIYLSRRMPGLYSSPFLLAAALYLLVSTRRLQREPI